MAIKKATARILVDDVNARQAEASLVHLRAAARADSEGRSGEIMPNLVKSAMFMEGFVYFVPPDVYEKRFGRQAVEERRFYNIGGGENWYHPCWQVIDTHLMADGAGLRMDFTDGNPWPIADCSAKLVYSSHCMEHLDAKTLGNVMAEIHRILEPGGLFRVVVPDMDIYLRAYQRGDNGFFTYVNDNSGQYGAESVEQNFLCQFAFPLSRHSQETGHLHMSDDEVNALFRDHAPEAAFDLCLKRLPDDYVDPGHPHVNWFNAAKMREVLQDAGFVDVTRSACVQSRETVFCDLSCFDYTAPEVSLYMEACKPAD